MILPSLDALSSYHFDAQLGSFGEFYFPDCANGGWGGCFCLQKRVGSAVAFFRLGNHPIASPGVNLSLRLRLGVPPQKKKKTLDFDPFCVGKDLNDLRCARAFLCPCHPDPAQHLPSG